MTRVATGLTDELWQQIRPPRARGQLLISFAVVVMLIGGVTAWWAGAFHPRVNVQWNEITTGHGTLLMYITMTNGTQLPLRVDRLGIDQPGFTLVASQLGDPPTGPTAMPIPAGHTTGHFSIRRNDSRRVILDIAVNCAKVTVQPQLDVTISGLLDRRTQITPLGDEAPLSTTCPGIHIP